MLSLKFATGYVDLVLERKRYDSDMLKLQRDLARFPGKIDVMLGLNAGNFRKGMVAVRHELSKLKTYTIGIRVDRARAVSDLNLLRQQTEQMQRRSFGTIPIRADLRPWRTAVKSVAFDIQKLRQFAGIPLGFTNTSNAHAQLNLLMQHMRSAQSMAKFSMGMGIGRGGGFGGGGGFIAGVGQGLGMPFATSPQMMAGQAVGGGIRASVASSAGIQSQVAELRRVSGMDAGQAQAFKKGLFGIGTTQAGVSFGDLMEIAQVGGRAGVADREGPSGLLTFTRDLAMVKNAIADMPTDELAESMIKVLNVFELGTDRVAGFGSALTAMDNASVASARDILNITTRLSGTAQAIGLTIPQILSLSSVLKDVGLTNEVAGTAFSMIFRKMATDSHNFAQQLGVDAKDFANAYRRDPMEALGMVIAKFNQMKDTIEGQEFIDELGFQAIRTGGGLQQLASKFEDVEKRAQLASTETATLNSLMAANALKSDTLEASYGKLKNALVELADAMGQPMLGPATDLTRTLTAITKQTPQSGLSMLGRSAAAAVGSTFNFDFLKSDLIFGPLFQRVGNGTENIKQSLVDDMMKALHGDTLANAAKPVGGGQPALPAKKPELVGPPRPDLGPAPNLLGIPGGIVRALMTGGEIAGKGLNVVGQGVPKLAKLLPEPKEKEYHYRSGLSGMDVSRQIQDDIFKMAKEKDKASEKTAVNTDKANTILENMLGELKKVVANAVARLA